MLKDVDTDLKKCCLTIIQKAARHSPLALSLSPTESFSPTGTWCNSRTNSPTMLNAFFKNEPFTSTNNLSLEWSRTNSPSEEYSRTNSPISTTHNNSAKESKNNSHIFSFSSKKKISSTWNYSRNSSPTGNQQMHYFDESIVDEMGRRRRGSGIIRIERELGDDDDNGDVIFSLQKLKENLHIAERRLSIK